MRYRRNTDTDLRSAEREYQREPSEENLTNLAKHYSRTMDRPSASAALRELGVDLKESHEALAEFIPPQKWRVVLFDVWGNAEDGWDINAANYVGYIDLPVDPTDEEIMQCIEEDYLVKGRAEIDNTQSDDRSIHFQRVSDEKPILRLELMEETEHHYSRRAR